jgi:hypothetical protein
MKNNKKYFLIIGVLFTSMVMIGVCDKFLVDKVAERVIRKLQKQYSPSPYGPGFDPDKLDLEKIKTVPLKTKYEGSWEDSWENIRKG